jgi:hypothetical protein
VARFDDVTRGDVLRAIEEHDQLGEVAFHAKYGFGRARTYQLVYEGRQYASKAVLGAAAGLAASEFSGGEGVTAPVLRRLGFDVSPGPSSKRETAGSWAAFMSWAARIAESLDLDAQEREYKVQVAARLADVRRAFLAGDVGWVDALWSVLRDRSAPANWLNWRFVADLKESATADEDSFARAVSALWDDSPDPVARLATFDVEMIELGSFTPGNRLALGSTLLMARDVTKWPPYNARPVKKASVLAGVPVDESTLVKRYEALLDLCGEVRVRAQQHGIAGLRDAVDAQGLIWAVVESAPDATWSTDERAALLAWRDGTTSSRRTRAAAVTDDALAESLDRDSAVERQAEERFALGDTSAPDGSATTKVRGSYQAVFASRVKSAYGYRCAITGISTCSFLVAAHIVPWAEDASIRIDPSNGICLSSLVDVAFENGYLQINPDYTVTVATDLIDDDPELARLLEPYDGQQLRMPSAYPPNPDFLRRKLESVTR